MHICRLVVVAAVLFGALSAPVEALSDTQPRAMAMGQAYTALARGPKAVFWNPANLALQGGDHFTWNFLGLGLSLLGENNSFSVQTYNDNFTSKNKFLDEGDKLDLLDEVPSDGLQFNLDVDPHIAALVPINGGIAFPLPWGVRSAITIGVSAGLEGQVPKDMFELILFGNQFEQDRLARGLPGGYNIANWDGSGWLLGSFNWAGARAWMPGPLKPYLSEFTTGITLKAMGGVFGEINDSSGEFTSRIDGADLDINLLTQAAGGVGFGVDLGVAGVSRDRKTTFSVALLNALDTISWNLAARQDSVFARSENLRVTRLLDEDVKKFDDILSNEDVDGDGEVDFTKKIGKKNFSRSPPAILRMGLAHQLTPRLTLAGNWDQAFSNGFGVETTPRVAGGLEYRLAGWFPTRFGVSLGGRSSGSSIGFAVGPFNLKRVQFKLIDLALVTRGGLFPGAAEGAALSVMLFELNMI